MIEQGGKGKLPLAGEGEERGEPTPISPLREIGKALRIDDLREMQLLLRRVLS